MNNEDKGIGGSVHDWEFVVHATPIEHQQNNTQVEDKDDIQKNNMYM